MAAQKPTVKDEGAEGVDWDELAPEVLEIIFRYLPVTDLLSCSVMSKNWKTVARDVLKRSRECYAHIKDFHRDIHVLNEVIASTSLMEMVNGLHIRNEIEPTDESGSASPSLSSSPSSSSPPSWSLPSSTQHTIRCYDVNNALQTEKARSALEEAKQKVDQVLCVQWRYMTVDMGPAVSPRDTSLLREIIFATSGSLEKLVIGKEEDWELIPCNGNEYSRLKVIQLLEQHVLHKIYTKICSPTIAPKLEEITGAMIKLSTFMIVWPEVKFPVDGFMLKRMKGIWLFPDVVIPKGEAKEAFQCISGLRRLDLQHYHCNLEDYWSGEDLQDFTSWSEFVLPLVLRSSDTLEELHMYTYDLYKLIRTSDELKFPNLRRLSLAAQSSTFKLEKQISALEQLNLPELCPNLEQVELTEESSLGLVEIDVLRTSEALKRSSLPVQIVLDCKNISWKVLHAYLAFFNAVYPKLTQVRILNSYSYVFKMSSIVWDMDSLEFLEINISRFFEDEVPLELDALLCGINIEEAELLFERRRKKNSKNFVVVPIRPSLFYAKSLKELKIIEGNCHPEFMVKYSCVIQVTVTENLPVRQMRNMKVTFEGSEEYYNQLKQMRAFSVLLSAQARENQDD